MKILLVQAPDVDTSPMMEITDSQLEKIKSVDPTLEIKTVFDNKEEIDKEIENTDIIITTDFSQINFEKAKNLKWIHTANAGINDLPQFVIDSDIIVTNSSGVHPTQIAEQVFGYMIMFSRQLNIFHRTQVLQKQWQKKDTSKLFELSGKTLGIVGYGRIGKRIGEIGKAFNMHVIAFVRTEKKGDSGIKYYTELNSMLSECDFVVNILPLTKETERMFEIEQFKSMKPTAYFINVGRGQSVKEKDLIEALEQKLIAGAGLDVFEEEPLPKESPLWNMENVIITPHSAGSVVNYMDKVIDIFCQNLKAFLNNKPFPNLVDKKRGY